MIGTIAAILAGVSTIVGISSRNAQREAQYQSQMQDLDRQKEQLDSQYKQLTESYDLSVSDANATVSDANEELEFQAKTTQANRDTALGVAADVQERQQTIEQMQLATLAVDASQAEGAATQAAATTGFRNAGTLMDAVEQVNRNSQDAITQAKAQLSLSRYSTFQSAKQAYTSATQQIESYHRQIELNNNELDRQLEELALQKQQADERYEQQSGYIESDINYMKTTGRALTNTANYVDVFGSLSSFGSTLYNIYG
jgi:chromosome segregation ATPase